MRIGFLVLLLICLGPMMGAGRAQSPPVAVTTDSVVYCDDLARRLPAAPSQEIARLRHEGLTMCGEGHVRGGIMQLRRALLLARGEKPEAP